MCGEGGILIGTGCVVRRVYWDRGCGEGVYWDRVCVW